MPGRTAPSGTGTRDPLPSSNESFGFVRDPSRFQQRHPARWGRRAWLVATGGLLGAAALDARLPEALAGKSQLSLNLHSIHDHRVKLGRGVPPMVVVKGQDPARNVRAALDRIGGIGHFVTRTDRVLVKPNVGWDRTVAQAANTNPAVVAEIVRACQSAGAKEVWVCDCPVNDPERCFRRSGIREAAERAGAHVVLPTEAKTLDVRLSADFGVLPVLAPFVQATKIINVPVAKDHGSARITAGMKNWIGITHRERSRFHQSLDESIASLALLMRPTLTVVDATRVLVRNGPQGGNLADVRQMDMLAVSVDPVALDAWVADLLGARLSDVEYLHLAATKKLGQIDYKKLGIAQITAG